MYCKRSLRGSVVADNLPEELCSHITQWNYWDLCQVFSPLWPQWALWILVKSAVTLESDPYFSVFLWLGTVCRMCATWFEEEMYSGFWCGFNITHCCWSSPEGDCVGACIICKGGKMCRFLLPFSESILCLFGLFTQGEVSIFYQDLVCEVL